jgi:hypothetical protein
MQLDNATNLDRKSGIRGTMTICFHCFFRRASPLLPRRLAKAMVGLCPVFFVPRTLRRTWGTLRYVAFLNFALGWCIIMVSEL